MTSTLVKSALSASKRSRDNDVSGTLSRELNAASLLIGIAVLAADFDARLDSNISDLCNYIHALSRTITFKNGFAVRLLTFVPGVSFTSATKSPELYFDLGCFMGKFTRAMQGYAHPASHRPDDLWNLDNVIACKAYLPDVADEDVRARVERFYGIYEKNTRPKLQYLRKSVIHNDVNEQNLLVASDGAAKITGLIDFGDMVFGTLINELAITLAYALLGENDIEMAARNIIRGYVQEYLLEAGELEVLSDLVAMRLVQSIIMTSNRAKEYSDNTYILISQKPARDLLKTLEGGNFVWA